MLYNQPISTLANSVLLVTTQKWSWYVIVTTICFAAVTKFSSSFCEEAQAKGKPKTNIWYKYNQNEQFLIEIFMLMAIIQT